MLLKSQKNILDRYLASTAGDVGGGCHRCYDELPATLRDSLERVKCQETLWCDAERYLSDKLLGGR